MCVCYVMQKISLYIWLDLCVCVQICVQKISVSKFVIMCVCLFVQISM